jgi:hypothetical protein
MDANPIREMKARFRVHTQTAILATHRQASLGGCFALEVVVLDRQEGERTIPAGSKEPKGLTRYSAETSTKEGI